MKVLRWIWVYLKDWKNLLTHTLVGVAILLVALYLPVKPFYRIIFLVIVVAFNIVRMRFSKKRKDKHKELEKFNQSKTLL
jgi:sterol desaturase/sphingolipid hydroxylase (fatty acid hydroxylase superfamily)